MQQFSQHIFSLTAGKWFGISESNKRAKKSNTDSSCQNHFAHNSSVSTDRCSHRQICISANKPLVSDHEPALSPSVHSWMSCFFRSQLDSSHHFGAFIKVARHLSFSNPIHSVICILQANFLKHFFHADTAKVEMTSWDEAKQPKFSELNRGLINCRQAPISDFNLSFIQVHTA